MPMRRCSGSSHTPGPATVAVTHRDRARVGHLEAGDEAQQRGLPRAARARGARRAAPRSTVSDAPATACVRAERLVHVDRRDGGRARPPTAMVGSRSGSVTLTQRRRSPGRTRPRCSPDSSAAAGRCPCSRCCSCSSLVGVALASSSGDDDTLVVYNGRSHYGDETVFDDFTEATGIELTLRGGTGPELFERLEREGADTPADVLVTTDLANLWRAEDAGLLAPSTSAELEANVPGAVHDPGSQWWALTARLRVPVVSTERVDRGRGHQLRGPRRPAVEGSHLPAHVEQRVQPVARRRLPRQARPRGDRGAAAVVDGQRPEDLQLRRRAARGDGGRRLRRRPHQPLLPGAARSTRTPTSRSRRRGPTRTAPVRTPTCRARAS